MYNKVKKFPKLLSSLKTKAKQH
jgi:hypothetical protein